VSQATFVEIDERIESAIIEIDNLLSDTSIARTTMALNLIKEKLLEATTYISMIHEEYSNLQGNNSKLLKGMNAANRQMKDMDLDKD